ncbi:paramyosin-like [Macrobrachium nipponense]|uniref:paramyosin-like n=1 Tax=Macrobrachium nipponense TaxID=159736 RepID=UPI0030C7CBA5
MNTNSTFDIVISLFGRLGRYIYSFVAPTPTRIGEYKATHYSVRVCGKIGKWMLEKKTRKLQEVLMIQILEAGSDPEQAGLKEHLNFHVQKLNQATKKAEMKEAYKETKNCWCRLVLCREMSHEPKVQILESIEGETSENEPEALSGTHDLQEVKESSLEINDLPKEIAEISETYYEFMTEAVASSERLDSEETTEMHRDVPHEYVDGMSEKLESLRREKEALEMEKHALDKERENFYKESEDLKRQESKFKEMLRELSVEKIRLGDRMHELMKAEEVFLITKKAFEMEREGFEMERKQAVDEEKAALSREWQAVENAKKELHHEREKLQKERAAFNKEKKTFDSNAKDCLLGKEEEVDKNREAQNYSMKTVKHTGSEREHGDGFLEELERKINVNFNDTLNDWEKNIMEKMTVRFDMGQRYECLKQERAAMALKETIDRQHEQLVILKKEKVSLLNAVEHLQLENTSLIKKVHEQQKDLENADRIQSIIQRQEEHLENLEEEKVSLLNAVEHLQLENTSLIKKVHEQQKDLENADRIQSIIQRQEEHLENLEKEKVSLLKCKLNICNLENTSLIKKVHEQQKDLENADRIQSIIQRQEEHLENLEKEKVSLLNAVEHLQLENTSLIKKVHEQQKDLENADRIQSIIQEARGESRKLEEEKKLQSYKEVHEQQKDLENADRIQSIIQRQEEHLEDLEEEKVSLLNAVEHLQLENTSLIKKVHEQQKDLENADRIQSIIQRQEEHLENLEEKKKVSLSNAVEHLQLENTSLIKKVHEQQKDLENADRIQSIIQRQEEHLENLEEEKVSLLNAVEHLQLENTSLIKKVHEQQKDLENADRIQSIIQRQEEHLENLEEEKVSLLNAVEHLQLENTSLIRKVHEQQKDLENADRIQSIIQRQEEHLENLEKEKVSLLNAVEHLQLENTSLIKKVHEQQKDLENADRIQSIIQRQEEHLENLEKEKVSLLNAVEHLQLENTSLIKKVHEQQKDLENADRIQSIIQRQEENLENLEEEKVSLLNAVEHLQLENTSL